MILDEFCCYKTMFNITKIHISQKYMSLTYKRNNQHVIIVKSTWFRQKVAKTMLYM